MDINSTDSILSKLSPENQARALTLLEDFAANCEKDPAYADSLGVSYKESFIGLALDVRSHIDSLITTLEALEVKTWERYKQSGLQIPEDE